MKILKLKTGTFDWIPLESDPDQLPYRIILSDNQVMEISEEQDCNGLSYLAVKTPDGRLIIYPKSANAVSFRVINL